MGWIPRYVVMGGMYGGARCPAGDLQILVNKMENHAKNRAFWYSGRNTWNITSRLFRRQYNP